MKKYYYYSKKDLKFIEIGNYRKKFIALVALSSILVSFLFLEIYLVVNEITNLDTYLLKLQSENKLLKTELNKAQASLFLFSDNLDSLSQINNDLRLANNLEPIALEDKNIGTGGAAFNQTNIINDDSDINDVIASLKSTIEAIATKIKLENKNYSEIKNTMAYNSKLFDIIPAIKPAAGSYGDRFGMRYHPILKISRMHKGVDIRAYYNTPVYAPGGGRVEFAGRKGGFGKTIIINHGFGYKTLYAHLNKYKVKARQKVKRGDLIGLTGSSGRLSTGPHLHYEVSHNGIVLNPRNFIFDDVKIFELANK